MDKFSRLLFYNGGGFRCRVCRSPASSFPVVYVIAFLLGSIFWLFSFLSKGFFLSFFFLSLFFCSVSCFTTGLEKSVYAVTGKWRCEWIYTIMYSRIVMLQMVEESCDPTSVGESLFSRFLIFIYNKEI